MVKNAKFLPVLLNKCLKQNLNSFDYSVLSPLIDEYDQQIHQLEEERDILKVLPLKNISVQVCLKVEWVFILYLLDVVLVLNIVSAIFSKPFEVKHILYV